MPHSSETLPTPNAGCPLVRLCWWQESGRELARDIKRKALKRKKTRIEEKLEQAKEKVTDRARRTSEQPALVFRLEGRLAAQLRRSTPLSRASARF